MARKADGPSQRQLRIGEQVRHALAEVIQRGEVREVPAGQECGMAFERYEDMRVGDVIECYRVEEIARSL